MTDMDFKITSIFLLCSITQTKQYIPPPKNQYRWIPVTLSPLSYIPAVLSKVKNYLFEIFLESPRSQCLPETSARLYLYIKTTNWNLAKVGILKTIFW